jgi:nitrate reductase NapE component
MSSDSEPGTFLAGAGLVWRRQRLVWWIFAATVVFAIFATQGMVERAGAKLNHSVASRRLVNGFDLGAVIELNTLPESPLQLEGPTMIHFSIVFAIFMMFATGGILATYLHDEIPRTGTFFEACGYHFWRFVRLFVYLAILLAILGGIAAGMGAIHDRIDENSISPFPAVFFLVAAILFGLLLLSIARLWFDMAQILAIAEDEKRMHKALRRAASLLRHNFLSLLWPFVSISIIGSLLIAFGLRVWMVSLSPQSIISAFVLSQLMVLVWIGTRLWQRASETVWYRRYAEASVQQPAWVSAPVVGTSSVAIDPAS